MIDIASLMEEKRKRIRPTIFNPRYYHLRELKRSLLQVVDRDLAVLPKGRLVDYGCGSMPYKAWFGPYVAEYTGADIEENTAADMQVLREKPGVPDQSADVVLSAQVSELVAGPELYLYGIYQVLRTKGMPKPSTYIVKTLLPQSYRLLVSDKKQVEKDPCRGLI